MKTVQAFQAFDGSLHLTEDECRKHNMRDLPSALSGLTREQVQDAMDGKDHALGDAIEAAAAKCKAKRIERGDLRRKPNKSPVAPQPPVTNET